MFHRRLRQQHTVRILIHRRRTRIGRISKIRIIFKLFRIGKIQRFHQSVILGPEKGDMQTVRIVMVRKGIPDCKPRDDGLDREMSSRR